MVQRDQSDEGRKEAINTATDEKDEPTDGDAEAAREDGLLARRSVLKLSGAAVAASALGATAAFGNAAAFEVSDGDGYEVWTVSGKEIYDLSDGEDLSNVLIDQTADGACLTIRSRNKSNWTVRNVGFVGVGQAGDGGNRFQFQVSAPSGATGLIENVWANGKARDGQPATELGGIYVRSSHAGHLDIRHSYIEGFGNNAVYASAVGKDNGNDGSVTMENCYHRDNTVSQFRFGSPDSSIRNCVGVVNDPDGDRGWYPDTDGNRNARGIWGKHFIDQRVENCSFYVSPDDVQPDGVFEARYIADRSHGQEAVVESVGCEVNPDAPQLTGSTSNATVNYTDLGESPTVTVIQDGGVPLSPKAAAKGDRSMPPELPGADTSDSTSDSTTDDSTTLDRTLTIDGSDAGWTDYEFTVSGEVENNPDVGTFDDDDNISGSTASGFVNGGIDGYIFSGDITEITVDGDADIVLDGEVVDPSTLGDADPTITTNLASGLTSSEATLNGTLDSLGGAESADVSFDWRAVGASSWNSLAAGTLSAAGSFSAALTDLAAETDYEYRAVVSASDGDVAAGSTTSFTTLAASTLDRTLTVDGSDTDKTTYEFTVSGDLEENPDVGSLGGGDKIEGSTASGFVNGGVDGYVFSGDVTDITVDGNADIVLDGQVVDPATLGEADLDRTVTIDGSDAGWTDYEVTVSGEIENNPDVGSFDADDDITDSTATGFVNGGVDGYVFSGEIVAIAVEGDADLVVDGQVVDPDSLILPNKLVFDAAGSTVETNYAFEVSGDLVNDTALGALESDDTLDGDTVTGTVTGDDVDGFRFSGDLVSLQLDGDASVVFEDNDG